jgi:hypothetical protein
MRKQDRIANEKQNRSKDLEHERMQARPDREHMRGSASENETPPRPQRQSGKLPLPD